ncbi:hypothetical protein PSHO110982_01905 [Pseudostreptobacillus hongkongensis]
MININFIWKLLKFLIIFPIAVKSTVQTIEIINIFLTLKEEDKSPVTYLVLYIAIALLMIIFYILFK